VSNVWIEKNNKSFTLTVTVMCDDTKDEKDKRYDDPLPLGIQATALTYGNIALIGDSTTDSELEWLYVI
jgi:hypothetical protein